MDEITQAADRYVLAVNAATLGLVDELLWLPSPTVAVKAVALLYGEESLVPDQFLARVGRGHPVPLASLLGSPRPLALLLPRRLGSPASWRDSAGGVKAARAAARQRYRELRAMFVAGAAGAMGDGAGTLLRHTYGVRGHWSWGEATRRILDRVVALNRAALGLLGAAARGQSRARIPVAGDLALPRAPEASEAALDVLAGALPPVAIPDFARLAACLADAVPVLAGDECLERYQSLFAEMLGLSSLAEVRS